MSTLQKTGFLTCVVVMGFLPPHEAVAEFARTPQEEAMCQALIYNGRDTSDRANWGHMHHFCDCMRFTNRAYSAIGNRGGMHGTLQFAIGHCDYVLSHTTPDFYMRAEVHLQKGKALRLDRQDGKAAGEFMEAIKGNPKLAQAYVELADIQTRNKKSGEALKTVTEGLRHSPESKLLRRRYTELGGKLPYPEPVLRQSSPPPEAEAATSAPSSNGGQLPPAPAAAEPAEVSVPMKAAEKSAEPGASPAESSKIGSPTNPWCRFCPDPVAKP